MQVTGFSTYLQGEIGKIQAMGSERGHSWKVARAVGGLGWFFVHLNKGTLSKQLAL